MTTSAPLIPSGARSVLAFGIKEGVTGMRNILSLVVSVCVVACVAPDEDSQTTESSAKVSVDPASQSGSLSQIDSNDDAQSDTRVDDVQAIEKSDNNEISPSVNSSCKTVTGAAVCFARGTPAHLILDDTACDGHGVYVLYRVNAGAEKRANNSSGCGNRATIAVQSGSFNIQYRVCVDIQLGGDRCSAFVFDHN